MDSALSKQVVAHLKESLRTRMASLKHVLGRLIAEVTNSIDLVYSTVDAMVTVASSLCMPL